MNVIETEQELTVTDKYKKLIEGRESKMYDLTEETIEYIQDKFDKTYLGTYGFKIQFIGKRMKQFMTIKVVADDIKYKSGYDILIAVNEDLFFVLDEEQQTMLVANELNRIQYNAEKDKLKLAPYEVLAGKFLFEKYGQEKALNMCALVNELKTIK